MRPGDFLEAWMGQCSWPLAAGIQREGIGVLKWVCSFNISWGCDQTNRKGLLALFSITEQFCHDMPFFSALSPFCSVTGFYWINRNRFHDYWNRVWWPRGWGITRCSGAAAHLDLVSLLPGWGRASHYLVHFTRRGGGGGGASAQALCRFASRGSRWRCEMSESAQTRQLPVMGLLQKLEEELGSQCGPCSQGESRDTFREQEKNNAPGSQRFEFESGFSIASELPQLLGSYINYALMPMTVIWE